MPSLLLDLVVILVVAWNAWRGLRTGLIAGGLGLLGVGGGALLGLWLGPFVFDLLPAGTLDTLGHLVAIIVIVLVGVVLGDALLGRLGRRLASHEVGSVHAVDRALGLVAGGVVSALVLGLVATALRPVLPTPWVRVIDDAVVLPTLERAVPDPVTDAAARLPALLNAAGVPSVFADPRLEPELPAAEPDDAVTGAGGVRAAADSVVRIAARQSACRSPFTAASGSGWVSDPERVVTNAHVIAGSEDVRVQVRGRGRSLPATVVAFRPDLDLAVLRVPGLRADPLPRTGELPSGADVAVAGFPGGGSYTVTSGRVRGTINAIGRDIYGDDATRRNVYALRAHVEQGNSGGPVLTPEGRVAGTVFAKSTDGGETAYALTEAQSAATIDQAADATEPVGTGACVR